MVHNSINDPHVSVHSVISDDQDIGSSLFYNTYIVVDKPLVQSVRCVIRITLYSLTYSCSLTIHRKNINVSSSSQTGLLPYLPVLSKVSLLSGK